MLFDLRGRGRRRAVQAIYLGLAVLMGGGLVLFGIGGNTSGGLFDAFSSDNNKATSTNYSKDIKKLEEKIRLQPKDTAARARLVSLRIAEGGVRGGFDGDKDGIAEFRQAAAAWTAYLAQNPPKTDLSVARQMVNVYQTGLNDPDKAVGVMDVIIDETEPPQADLYKQYAQLAFVAGQTRKGDLAVDKAVSLSPPADRRSVRDALTSIKTQITQAAAQAATAGQGAAGATGAAGAAGAVPVQTTGGATTTTTGK